MPQYIVLALVGAVAVLGYKYLKRAQAMRPVEVRAKAAYLERGADGVYRPVERRVRG